MASLCCQERLVIVNLDNIVSVVIENLSLGERNLLL